MSAKQKSSHISAGGSASEFVSKGMMQAHTSSHLRPAGALGTDCGPATVSVTEGVSNTIAKDAVTGEVTKAETRFATESFTVKPSEATQNCPAGTYADTKETTLTQVDGGPTRVSMSHSKIHTDQAGNVRSQTQSVSGGDYDAVQKGEASIGERVGSNERGAFAAAGSKDLSESISAVVAKLSPEQANKVAEMMAQSKSKQLGAFSNEAGSQSESMSIDKSQQATAQEQSRQSQEQGGQSREGKAEKQAEMEMDMGGM